jgi:hypothetical protein
MELNMKNSAWRNLGDVFFRHAQAHPCGAKARPSMVSHYLKNTFPKLLQHFYTNFLKNQYTGNET